MNQDSDIFPGEVTWPCSDISVSITQRKEGEFWNRCDEGPSEVRLLLLWGMVYQETAVLGAGGKKVWSCPANK